MVITEQNAQKQYSNKQYLDIPAFCNRTCASIDLLMLEEQTVPKHNLDDLRLADGGGIPGGVEGRCRPTILLM